MELESCLGRGEGKKGILDGVMDKQWLGIEWEKSTLQKMGRSARLKQVGLMGRSCRQRGRGQGQGFGKVFESQDEEFARLTMEKHSVPM